jgi:serine/threonine protein kinase/tetratricopeptide (TPR) repeat protein
MADQPASEKTIFHAAVAKASPTERAAYLDESCRGNEQLRREVEALLAAHDRLPAPPDDTAQSQGEIELDPPILLLPPGTVIGRYKLLEPIGEGGYGVVFMAEQTTPVKRRVALKIIKAGMDTRQVIARFEAERQALALMDHPNIAKVFDAGVTDTGRPYFVMELVKGTPITKHCDEHRLTPRDRLELFVQVCQAVQHAHQKGIIHRDLKPTNVLVTQYDGKPVPKVIDFGVAKATGQQLTERTMFTGFGDVIGTPQYMSPEQAELNQLDVDTRSDIYSLGVLLYELLTGTTPLESKRVREVALLEILRVIREEEPPRPSTRLTTTAELPSIAAQRGLEPKSLSGIVKGELDWIVMKALEKDRTRRYETAHGLARDIERYLLDEPVQACPPSASYRLRKFTRRHRVPLLVGGGFVSLLIAAAVVSTYQAIRIRAEQQKTLTQKLAADRERDRAVAAEQKALAEARKSEQVAGFMTEMLRGVSPSVARGRDTTMLREILDKTTKRLDRLKGQPAVEADLRMVLGNVYVGLAEDERAEAMYRTALTLRRELFGNKHADVARTLVALGDPLARQRRFAEAEAVITEGLAMERELLGKDHWDVAWALFYLGMMENRRGRYAQAETRLREALAIFRQRPNSDITGTLGQLALSLTRQRKYAEAEPIHRECIELGRKQAPSGSPDLAYALYNFGALLRDQGKQAESEPYFREALEIQRKQLPPGHEATLRAMKSLALSLIACDHGDEAIALIDELFRVTKGKAVPADLVTPLINPRLRHFQKAKDAAGCRVSAEMWEGLNRADAEFLYDAARFRAVTAAVTATDDSPEAARTAAGEADRAMEWLGKAVAAGYANSGRMRQDKDLDALRDRGDFQKILATLETAERPGVKDHNGRRPSSRSASQATLPTKPFPTTARASPP